MECICRYVWEGGAERRDTDSSSGVAIQDRPHIERAINCLAEHIRVRCVRNAILTYRRGGWQQPGFGCAKRF